MIVTDKSLESPLTIGWRSAFKSYDEMETGEPEFLINSVFVHGIKLCSRDLRRDRHLIKLRMLHRYSGFTDTQETNRY
jgi:hypothetical protein